MAKVNYALSYLKGTALEWFEPSIADGFQDIWMADWDEFVRELRVNFGPADPFRDAEEGLDALRMSDKHKIAKYSVSAPLFTPSPPFTLTGKGPQIVPDHPGEFL